MNMLYICGVKHNLDSDFTLKITVQKLGVASFVEIAVEDIARTTIHRK